MLIGSLRKWNPTSLEIFFLAYIKDCSYVGSFKTLTIVKLSLSNESFPRYW